MKDFSRSWGCPTAASSFGAAWLRSEFQLTNIYTWRTQPGNLDNAGRDAGIKTIVTSASIARRVTTKVCCDASTIHGLKGDWASPTSRCVNKQETRSSLKRKYGRSCLVGIRSLHHPLLTMLVPNMLPLGPKITKTRPRAHMAEPEESEVGISTRRKVTLRVTIWKMGNRYPGQKCVTGQNFEILSIS